MEKVDVYKRQPQHRHPSSVDRGAGPRPARDSQSRPPERSTLNLIEMHVNKVGVVLFQLGGPDSLEAIEPFLYNLFSDPDIIDFPFARIARQPLARLISTTRARHVRHHYAKIGGRSPILEFTRRQARALEAELRHDCDARVVVACLLYTSRCV